jgi:hypothetical protein
MRYLQLQSTTSKIGHRIPSCSRRRVTPTRCDPNTMYWHQAMQQSDKAEFIKAATAEVKSHVDNEHLVLMKRNELPEGTRVLAAVWSMKYKRRILTRIVYKWKARLNCHGGQQEHGINF